MIAAVQSTSSFVALTYCLKTYGKREIRNTEFRAFIMYFPKAGANANEIYRSLADVYDDSSLS